MKILSQKSKLGPVLVGALLISSAAFGLSQTNPTVIISGKRITARHANGHRPLAQAIYVADTEECSARTSGSTQLEVSDKCQYLRGLYRYVYVPEGQTERHQILLGFAVSKTSAQGHTILTDMPVELNETALAP